MRTCLLSIVALYVSGFTFRAAVQSLNQHSAIVALQRNAQAVQHEGRWRSAWSDPVIKLNAKNLSQAWFEGKTTPMSGFDVGVMQKIPLTARYQHLHQAFVAKEQSVQAQVEDHKRELLRALWQILITERQLHAEHKILQENRVWLRKTLKVAEQLYTNGKTTRRAVLDIQIREAEVRTALSNKDHARQEQLAKQQYLTGQRAAIDPASIPWQLLSNTAHDKAYDYREQALQHMLRAKTAQARAQRLAHMPDLTLAAAYRPDFDGHGNFFTFSVSMPLPVTASRRAAYAESLQAQQQAELQLYTYRMHKQSELNFLRQRSAKLVAELQILRNETQKFAHDSRRLAFISYRHGDATYAELLQAELQLQNILLKQATLQAQLAVTHLKHRYLKGAMLHE